MYYRICLILCIVVVLTNSVELYYAALHLMSALFVYIHIYGCPVNKNTINSTYMKTELSKTSGYACFKVSFSDNARDV